MVVSGVVPSLSVNRCVKFLHFGDEHWCKNGVELG
jgi:hypothetical protein